MDQVQEKAIKKLNVLIVKMLDKADTVLFDNAMSASSNQQQEFFFEAMRNLRIERKGLEKKFSQQLVNNFLSLEKHSTTETVTNVISFNTDTLTLIQKDQLDETITIDGIIAKANLDNELVLAQLINRFNSLVNFTIIDDTNNPLKARFICEAFQQATQHLNFEIKPKLVLYKIFNSEVISNLGQLYSEINLYLVSQGILPNLPGTPVIKHTKLIPSLLKTSSPFDVSDKGTDVLEALKGLVVDQKCKTIDSNAPADTENSINQNKVPTQPAIDMNLLIQALSTVQHNSHQASTDCDGSEVEAEPVIDIRNQIGEVLSASGATFGKPIGQGNESAIDIVSMLFEFILCDRSLPDEFKALLGRLQIPLLKVAILDDSFFSKGSHPARKLLNEMAHAGIGWTASSHTGLKDKITEIVNHIVSNFENDISIFSEALQNFQNFNEKYSANTMLKIKRLSELEEGRARARVQAATIKADVAIKQIVGNLQLPESISHLIHKDWRSLMQLIYLRKGDKNKDWDKHLQVGTDLVASLIPVVTTEAKDRLQGSLPELIKNIKSGLNTVGSDEFENSNLFTDLEQLHIKVMEGETVLITSKQKLEPDNSSQSELKSDVEHESSDSEIDSTVTLPEEMSLESKPVIVPISEATQTVPVDFDEKSLEDREQPTELSCKSISLEDEQYKIEVENLYTGTWFEKKETDQEKPLHCKLVAIIASVGKYIFVNHSGKKVAEYSQEQLITAMKNKQISMLGEGVIFERALKSIISNFREQKYKSDEMWS